MYLRMPTIFLGIKTPLSFLYHLVRCLSGSHNHNEDFEMRQVQVTKRDDEIENLNLLNKEKICNTKLAQILYITSTIHHNASALIYKNSLY
mgnify:CR=1 FL=1